MCQNAQTGETARLLTIIFEPETAAFLLLPILCRAASSAALSHTGGFRVGGGVHDSYMYSSADWWGLLLPLALTPDRRDQRLLVSHPKDTGKEGLTELPKFRTQSRPQWESNPAGKNVRSPFKANALTHSATAPLTRLPRPQARALHTFCVTSSPRHKLKSKLNLLFAS